MGSFEELVHSNQKELALFEDRRVKRFLKLLEDSRKSIKAEISSADVLNQRRLLSLMKQLEEIEGDLIRNIRSAGANAVTDIEKLVSSHSREQFKMLYPKAEIGFDQLSGRMLFDLSNQNLGNISNMAAAEIGTIRSVLFSKVGVLGQNPRKIARDLAGTDSRFANMKPRIATIIRTESSTLYNAQTENAIEAGLKAGLKVNKRIIETMDAAHNHPISRVINGLVQVPGVPFKVSVASVNREASALGKNPRSIHKSIFWDKIGEYYQGQGLPAHYNERGTVVPTRKEPSEGQ